MINRIYLDLDGVIRDWTKGVRDFYNIDFPDKKITDWGSLTKEVIRVHNISEKQFWDWQDENFWINLELTSEAKEILNILENTKIETFLFTAPTLNNAGWSQQWIKENLPSFFNSKHYIIGPTKWVCASPTSLLVDDAEKNIDPWVNHGGYGFLWPQPWNRNRIIKHEKDKLLYLKREIKYFNS